MRNIKVDMSSDTLHLVFPNCIFFPFNGAPGPNALSLFSWASLNIDIIPVIGGATGLIKTNLKNYLKDIPGSPSVEEIQMCAITGTVSIIKRALSH